MTRLDTHVTAILAPFKVLRTDDNVGRCNAWTS